MPGKWDVWYKNGDERNFRAIDSTTYAIGGKFLAEMKEVEDWGCGFGGFKPYCKPKYIGVDGSKTPYVDVVADLRDYRSSVDGIYMRHVLEHNYDWEKVLANALASFRKRMCLVLFTPFSYATHETRFIEDVGVPDISFSRKDIESYLKGHKWKLTEYRGDHIYLIERNNADR